MTVFPESVHERSQVPAPNSLLLVATCTRLPSDLHVCILIHTSARHGTTRPPGNGKGDAGACAPGERREPAYLRFQVTGGHCASFDGKMSVKASFSPCAWVPALLRIPVPAHW